MEIVSNCLRVRGGIIALVRAVEPEKTKGFSADRVSISVRSYGLDILLDDAVIIPLPEFMLSLFLENSTIWFYRADDTEYLWEPLLTIEIPKEEIIEAKGAYKFIQLGSGQGRTVEEGEKKATIDRCPDARYCPSDGEDQD